MWKGWWLPGNEATKMALIRVGTENSLALRKLKVAQNLCMEADLLVLDGA